MFPPTKGYTSLNMCRISDETFCTQSQIMVEKVLEFSAESLCLRQGMATSGRWCHITMITLLDQVTPVGEWQLGCRCPCSVQASLGVFWWPPWFSSWTPGLPCPISWPLSGFLVAIPWWQRDSAENSGTFSTIIWLCVQNVSSEIMFPESKTFTPRCTELFNDASLSGS